MYGMVPGSEGGGLACRYCGSWAERQPWSCPSCSGTYYCSYMCMNDAKLRHAQVCTGTRGRPISNDSSWEQDWVSEEEEEEEELEVDYGQEYNGNAITRILNPHAVDCWHYREGHCEYGMRCKFRHVMKLRVCKFFAAGKCRNGTDCPFLHPTLPSQPARVVPSKQPELNNNYQQQPKFETQKKDIICQHFQTGSCAYGDNCYKKHVQIELPAADTGPPEEEAVEKVPVPICEYFHRGKCTFGDNCVKSHDPLPLYKKDLKNVVLRTAAEVAAEKKTAEGAKAVTNGGSSSSKVKTELVKIVKNRSVRTAASAPSLQTSAARPSTNNASFLRAGVLNGSTQRSGVALDSPVSHTESLEIFYSDSEGSDLGEDEEEPAYNQSNQQGTVQEQSATSGRSATQSSSQSAASCQPAPFGYPSSGSSTSFSTRNSNCSFGTLNTASPFPDGPPPFTATVQPSASQVPLPFSRLSSRSSSQLSRDQDYNNSDEEESDQEKDEAEDAGTAVGGSGDADNRFSALLLLQQEEEKKEKEKKKRKPKKKKQAVVKENPAPDAVAVAKPLPEQPPQEPKKSKKERREEKKRLQKANELAELVKKGKRDYQWGCYTEAIAHFTTAIERSTTNSPDPELYSNRCAAYLMNKNFKEALSDGRKCLELGGGKEGNVHLHILQCCIVLGLLEEGRTAAQNLRQYNSKQAAELGEKLNHIEKYFNQSVIYADDKKYAQAEEAIDRARAICYQSGLYTLYKAKYLCLQRKVGEAQRILATINTKDTVLKCGLGYFVQGLCSYYTADLTRTLTALGEAKKTLQMAKVWHEKASKMRTLYSAGTKAMKEGNLSNAITQFNLCLEVDPGNEQFNLMVLKERAQVLYQVRDYKYAVEDATHIINIQPEVWKNWERRSCYFSAWGKHRAALEDMEHAYRLSGSFNLKVKVERLRQSVASEERKECVQGTYYEVLGVERRATAQQIRQNYLTMARQFHPDKHGTAPEKEKKEMENKMKELSRAYKTLSDENKRREYDFKLDMADCDEEEDDDYFSPQDFFETLVRMFRAGYFF